jgi:outer membrane receptor protein involved in Fe transport
VRSDATTLLNLGVRYVASPALTLSLDVFNLTNQSSNDIAYYYASCTAREVAAGQCGAGINDTHVHPMEPRSVRLTARVNF